MTMNAAKLRKYMEEFGLTQTRLAKGLDVDVRTVRRWVTGESTIPRVVDYALRYMAQNTRKYF
jgi:transcriptional regulator with XRE-family HTH domain